MPPTIQLDVSGVRAKLSTRFRTQHKEWFNGGGTWPLPITLGAPTQAVAMANIAAARAWAAQWMAWKGPGTVRVETRNWGTMGANDVPVAIDFGGPGEVAAMIGQGLRWSKATGRRAELLAAWPSAAAGLSRFFDDMADYPAADWERLQRMLAWIMANPKSALYPRQLPVHGLDSKWLEERLTTVQGLLGAVSGKAGSLFTDWGLLQPPALVRLQVLDPVLRQRVGGLRGLQAPLQELATLDWAPSTVIVVENLQTGLALPDLNGAVAVLRLGYGVDQLAALPWVGKARVLYWGDIDSHGFAILARARQHVPGLASIMMDVETWEAHRDLTGNGDDGRGSPALELLTTAENEAYQRIRAGDWGSGARLEQERIAWAYALARIQQALQ